MKHKKGDEVRITAEGSDIETHDFKIGEIVTIVKVYVDYYWAKGEDEHWGIDEDECEAIKTDKA
jgi:hypothetical protein